MTKLVVIAVVAAVALPGTMAYAGQQGHGSGYGRGYGPGGGHLDVNELRQSPRDAVSF